MDRLGPETTTLRVHGWGREQFPLFISFLRVMCDWLTNIMTVFIYWTDLFRKPAELFLKPLCPMHVTVYFSFFWNCVLWIFFKYAVCTLSDTRNSLKKIRQVSLETLCLLALFLMPVSHYIDSGLMNSASRDTYAKLSLLLCIPDASWNQISEEFLESKHNCSIKFPHKQIPFLRETRHFRKGFREDSIF